MIARLFRILLLSFALVSLLVSCHTREVAYLSDATRDSAQEILSKYTATILPGDELDIHVSSQTPESVVPFNYVTHQYRIQRSASMNDRIVDAAGNNRTVPTYYNVDVEGYTVSEKGTILFPVLGTISVVGLTHDSLCHYLENRLRDEGYVNDPQVTVNLLNFRVIVVGEVKIPRQIHVDGTRLTILEALAICGDMTDYGMRENVTVVRQENGQRQIGEMDLTKHEFLDSPYYYLHNNDIVYVEPNHRKKVDSDRDPNIPKYISIAVSAANIININIRTAQRLLQINQ